MLSAVSTFSFPEAGMPKTYAYSSLSFVLITVVLSILTPTVTYPVFSGVMYLLGSSIIYY